MQLRRQLGHALAHEWAQLSDATLRHRILSRSSSVNAALNVAAERDPEGPLASTYWLWVAENFARDKRVDEACAAFTQCAEHEASLKAEARLLSVTEDALLQRAQIQAYAKRPDAAFTTYGELLRLYPANRAARLHAGVLAERTGQLDYAAQFYSNIAATSDSTDSHDPTQAARRALALLSDTRAELCQSVYELVDKMSELMERSDRHGIDRVLSRSHFCVGSVGGHLQFESADLRDALMSEFSISDVSIDGRLLGSGGKRYLPTRGWRGKWFDDKLLLVLQQLPRGWQFTGVVLLKPNALWADRWKATHLAKNSPLPFELQAPWPSGVCFAAGGFNEYLVEQAAILTLAAFWPFGTAAAAVLTEALSASCCGFGLRGFYYNQHTHQGDDAFAVDFTRYIRYAPYAPASHGVAVLAAREGVVSRVVSYVSTGDSIEANRVEIEHENPATPGGAPRYTTKYLHLDGPWLIPVSTNMNVRVGTRLGTMDDTGNSAIHHLHFSIHDNAAGGASVRPYPMSGETLLDSEGGKCIRSTNVEYTGSNQVIDLYDFAGQNWVITPVALAANETPPTTVASQKWQLVLSGIVMAPLKGTGNQFLRETMAFIPNMASPINWAINRHSVPRPPGTQSADYDVVFQVEQWAPHAAVSSSSNKGHAVDSGCAVDLWRPSPFIAKIDVFNNAPVGSVFSGVQVDVAVSDIDQYLHRLSYHITLIGRIRFVKPIIIQ